MSAVLSRINLAHFTEPPADLEAFTVSYDVLTFVFTNADKSQAEVLNTGAFTSHLPSVVPCFLHD